MARNSDESVVECRDRVIGKRAAGLYLGFASHCFCMNGQVLAVGVVNGFVLRSRTC